jgi:hypothetical protein
VAGLKEVSSWMDKKDVEIAMLKVRVEELEKRLNLTGSDEQ